MNSIYIIFYQKHLIEIDKKDQINKEYGESIINKGMVSKHIRELKIATKLHTIINTKDHISVITKNLLQKLYLKVQENRRFRISPLT